MLSKEFAQNRRFSSGVGNNNNEPDNREEENYVDVANEGKDTEPRERKGRNYYHFYDGIDEEESKESQNSENGDSVENAKLTEEALKLASESALAAEIEYNQRVRQWEDEQREYEEFCARELDTQALLNAEILKTTRPSMIPTATSSAASRSQQQQSYNHVNTNNGIIITPQFDRDTLSARIRALVEWRIISSVKRLYPDDIFNSSKTFRIKTMSGAEEEGTFGGGGGGGGEGGGVSMMMAADFASAAATMMSANHSNTTFYEQRPSHFSFSAADGDHRHEHGPRRLIHASVDTDNISKKYDADVALHQKAIDNVLKREYELLQIQIATEENSIEIITKELLSLDVERKRLSEIKGIYQETKIPEIRLLMSKAMEIRRKTRESQEARGNIFDEEDETESDNDDEQQQHHNDPQSRLGGGGEGAGRGEMDSDEAIRSSSANPFLRPSDDLTFLISQDAQLGATTRTVAIPSKNAAITVLQQSEYLNKSIEKIDDMLARKVRRQQRKAREEMERRGISSQQSTKVSVGGGRTAFSAAVGGDGDDGDDSDVGSQQGDGDADERRTLPPASSSSEVDDDGGWGDTCKTNVSGRKKNFETQKKEEGAANHKTASAAAAMANEQPSLVASPILASYGYLTPAGNSQNHKNNDHHHLHSHDVRLHFNTTAAEPNTEPTKLSPDAAKSRGACSNDTTDEFYRQHDERKSKELRRKSSQSTLNKNRYYSSSETFADDTSSEATTTTTTTTSNAEMMAYQQQQRRKEQKKQLDQFEKNLKNKLAQCAAAVTTSGDLHTAFLANLQKRQQPSGSSTAGGNNKNQRGGLQGPNQSLFSSMMTSFVENGTNKTNRDDDTAPTFASGGFNVYLPTNNVATMGSNENAASRTAGGGHWTFSNNPASTGGDHENNAIFHSPLHKIKLQSQTTTRYLNIELKKAGYQSLLAESSTIGRGGGSSNFHGIGGGGGIRIIGSDYRSLSVGDRDEEKGGNEHRHHHHHRHSAPRYSRSRGFLSSRYAELCDVTSQLAITRTAVELETEWTRRVQFEATEAAQDSVDFESTKSVERQTLLEAVQKERDLLVERCHKSKALVEQLHRWLMRIDPITTNRVFDSVPSSSTRATPSASFLDNGDDPTSSQKEGGNGRSGRYLKEGVCADTLTLIRKGLLSSLSDDKREGCGDFGSSIEIVELMLRLAETQCEDIDH